MKAVVVAAQGFALALALGCIGSALERQAPHRTRFLLSATPAAASARALPAALWVDRVRVSPLFSGTGFVYRTGDSTYGSDFLHEFFAPPGEVLREAMLEWFRSGGRFASLERSAESSPEYRLESAVDRLYADLRDPADPRVVLEARFRLIDLRGARPSQLLDLRVTEQEPAEDASPRALVDAWNRTLTRVLEQLDGEMRAATATAGRAPAG
jgi:uncharacterized lipoprotein YmbA